MQEAKLLTMPSQPQQQHPQENSGEKVSICWASDYYQAKWIGIGNAYGYYTHERMMREYTGQIATISDDAPVVVHIQTADKFKRIDGKKNYLFSMFEAESLPATYVKGINEADHLIVPCEHNKRLFQKYTDKPIDVCHEGVDTAVYTFKERTFSIPFRFLWIGAPNPRKGWEETMTAWKYGGFDKVKEIELYVKTTLGDINEKKANIIFDSRNMTKDELVALYHSAHCFLFPTRGEGWGLTLSEAMATGIPCIATRYSGTADFFDSYVGYTLKYKMFNFNLQAYQLRADMATPDVEDLMQKMAYVFTHYKEAKQKGRLASRRIQHYFTWPRAAQRLVEIIKNSNMVQ